MMLNFNMHVSELNAAIALFAGAAEKLRQQAEAQLQPPMPVPPQPAAPVAETVEVKQ